MTKELNRRLERLNEIVDGIDRDDAEDGWWESSEGVDFGSRVKTKLAAEVAASLAVHLLHSTDQGSSRLVGVFGTLESAKEAADHERGVPVDWHVSAAGWFEATEDQDRYMRIEVTTIK